MKTLLNIGSENLVEPFIELGWERRFRWFSRPLRVGKRLVIVPSGSRYKAHASEIIIEIAPGQAFGTGGHATTKGCLLGLEAEIKGGERVLDLGTGTGILAISAKKLGASMVLALDIDYRACRVAMENLKKNNIQNGINIVRASIEAVQGPFHVIVANIRADILAGMVKDFPQLLLPKGILILSGIKEQEGLGFADFLARHGFIELNSIVKEGWMTMTCKKGPFPH